MVRARKRFGQHFLEPAWVDKLIRAIGPEAGQTFLEVGPGRGALTRPLAAAARHVVAFEIDRDLAAELRDAAMLNVTVVEGDFLKVTTERLQRALSVVDHSSTIRVVGNLPFNVASPILFHLADLFARGLPITDATVMLQREVADRLAAPPGSRDYGVLSVLMGQTAAVTRLLTLPPGAFRPAPKVTSALVRLRFHEPTPRPSSPRRFEALVQAIFTRRRKTLANALKALPSRANPAQALAAAGLDGRRRPETLTISELVQLADCYPAHGPDRPLAEEG